jgi:hypothetical protein
VKKAIKKRLNEIGAYHHWPVQMGMGSPCLDCHGCLKGLYFAIEAKKPGEVPTLRQRITAQQIRDAGGITLVIDTVEKARALFDDRFPVDRPATGPL